MSRGHEAGANKITEFLDWCDDVGVKVVTVWMLSTDNLSRPADELELLRIIEQTVEELTAIGHYRSTRSARSTCCRAPPPRR